jgi:hypothetical protein
MKMIKLCYNSSFKTYLKVQPTCQGGGKTETETMRFFKAALKQLSKTKTIVETASKMLIDVSMRCLGVYTNFLLNFSIFQSPLLSAKWTTRSAMFLLEHLMPHNNFHLQSKNIPSETCGPECQWNMTEVSLRFFNQ